MAIEACSVVHSIGCLRLHSRAIQHPYDRVPDTGRQSSSARPLLKPRLNAPMKSDSCRSPYCSADPS